MLQMCGASPAMRCSDDKADNTQLPTLVTVAVDAIHLRRRLDLDQNFEMSGQVVWTGTSSMDIRMQLTQASSPTLERIKPAINTQPSSEAPTEILFPYRANLSRHW